MPVALSDAEVFGTTPPPRTKGLSDAEVFGTTPPAPSGALSDEEVFGPQESYVSRFGKSVAGGFVRGGASLLETVSQPADWIFGKPPPGAGSSHDVADWMRSYAPTLQPAQTTSETVTDIAGNVVGGFAPGLAAWIGGVPLAVLSGVKSAKEVAAEQGRDATVWEMTRDAIVEGVVRKIMGNVAERDMGVVTKGLAFGALSGAQDIGENRPAAQTSVDTGVNMLIGMIGPWMSKADRLAIAEAESAAKAGDGKGAMRHLDPVLQTHADEIALAAKVDPTGDDALPGSKAPDNIPTRTQINGEFPSVDAEVASEAAIRIAQKEYWTAQLRARLGANAENFFRGVQDPDRVTLMADYQQGGIDAVPDAFKPVFQDIKDVLKQSYSAENEAEINYEERQNYLPGYWKNIDDAKAHYESRPLFVGPRSGKPGFTKPKAFDDYFEGIDAGLTPKTTNPAVLAAWRSEAGYSAMQRVLTMKDMVESDLAVPVTTLTEQGMKFEPGSPFGPLPAHLAGWVQRGVGGKQYIVEPRAAQLLDYALKMEQGSLSRMLGFDEHGQPVRIAQGFGRAWMMARNATIPMKLALSAFHAIHIQQIDLFQTFVPALTRALNHNVSVDEFIRDIQGARNVKGREAYGRHLSTLMTKDPATLTPQEHLEVNIMLAGGFNPQRPGIYELHAEEAWRRLINDEVPSTLYHLNEQNANALAKAWGVAPLAAKGIAITLGRGIEAIQGPMFRDWIPSLKAAAYMNEAKTILARKPGLLDGTPQATKELRMELRRLRLSIDSRFGEFQYDKLFMPNLLKRALMGSMLSVGWNFGFIREFFGAIQDTAELVAPKLASKGTQREISTRMVYASVYIAGALMMGGMMTAFFTGAPPQSMTDLVYPKLPDGTRIQTQFFTREFGGIYFHLMEEGLPGLGYLAASKMAPLASTATEVLRNRDYYGRQVYDPNANIFEQTAEAMKHLATGTISPISIQATLQGLPQTPGQRAMALGGWNPAPGYVEKPGVVGRIQTAWSNQNPGRITPYAEVERNELVSKAKQYFKRWLRTKNPEDKTNSDKLLADYVKKYPEYLGKGGMALKHMLRSWRLPDGAAQFQELDRATQKHILNSVSQEDRAAYLQFAHADVRKEFAQ